MQDSNSAFTIPDAEACRAMPTSLAPDAPLPAGVRDCQVRYIHLDLEVDQAPPLPEPGLDNMEVLTLCANAACSMHNQVIHRYVLEGFASFADMDCVALDIESHAFSYRLDWCRVCTLRGVPSYSDNFLPSMRDPLRWNG